MMRRLIDGRNKAVMMGVDKHMRALEAAAAALDLRLQAEAAEQGSYLHRFADGKLSLDVEWIDPNSLAEAAIVAYLQHLKDASESE